MLRCDLWSAQPVIDDLPLVVSNLYPRLIRRHFATSRILRTRPQHLVRLSLFTPNHNTSSVSRSSHPTTTHRLSLALHSQYPSSDTEPRSCMDQCCESCCRCCDANFGCLCRACDTCCSNLSVFMQRPFATVRPSCHGAPSPSTQWSLLTPPKKPAWVPNRSSSLYATRTPHTF